jgi:predicted dehydrogenase
MINIGIVGLGFIAATHIRAYRQIPDARVAAICNPSGRNLDGDFTNVGGNLGQMDPVRLDMSQVKAYRHFLEMLGDSDLDVIDICAPTSAHAELAIGALKSGKHVLCEKPMSRSSKLADEVCEAAAKARGFFMPAMCLRFWPEWKWLREAIGQKRYGNTLAARFRRVAEPPGWGPRTFFNGAVSGGALLDLHIHDTDFIQFCFGRPKQVHSTGYTLFSGSIDHIVTQYRVPGDAIVHAEGGWSMSRGFGFTMEYTVNFENATADYASTRGAEALRLCEKDKEPRVITFDDGDGFLGEIRYFLECVKKGRPPTIVTAQDGRSAIQICEAERQSIKSGQPVDI